ncbi:YbaB/EbfC family nucleoid-associated protein [Nonomuraea sp. NPDC049309]|uniref:YbaB/EbfC family nucleoid-associated protein n=1 Tax=Nonomuraea sp. NPDC049309 TaxID=3364350 RepID=UPI00372085D4
MADAFEATIEEMAREIDQEVARVRETYAEYNAIEHTSRSKDGLVAVTVGSGGRLLGIELNPRVYRSLSPSELAEAIKRQADLAAAEVAERGRALMAPLMPDTEHLDALFGENPGIDPFAPGSVTQTRRETGR